MEDFQGLGLTIVQFHVESIPMIKLPKDADVFSSMSIYIGSGHSSPILGSRKSKGGSLPTELVEGQPVEIDSSLEGSRWFGGAGD